MLSTALLFIVVSAASLETPISTVTLPEQGETAFHSVHQPVCHVTTLRHDLSQFSLLGGHDRPSQTYDMAVEGIKNADNYNAQLVGSLFREKDADVSRFYKDIVVQEALTVKPLNLLKSMSTDLKPFQIDLNLHEADFKIGTPSLVSIQALTATELPKLVLKPHTNFEAQRNSVLLPASFAHATFPQLPSFSSTYYGPAPFMASAPWSMPVPLSSYYVPLPYPAYYWSSQVVHIASPLQAPASLYFSPFLPSF